MPHLNFKRTTTTEHEVDAILMTEDVYVYRITTRTTHANRQHPTVSVTEGITSKANLTTYQKGASAMRPYATNWVALLASPYLLTVAQEQGRNSPAFMDVVSDLSQSPYTRFVEDTATARDLVFFERSTQLLYDRHKQPLPMAVSCSYLNGRFDNANYHLDKASKILMQREDIRIKSAQVSIPHYNADRRRNQHLEFVWVPNVEDYRRMISYCNEIGGQHPSMHIYRAMFELDILGLRAGGAAKFTDFFGR